MRQTPRTQRHADRIRSIAPIIVNAAGAQAGKIAATMGDDILPALKAAMMIMTERIAPLLEPVMSVAGRPLSFKQSDQRTLVIGGGLHGSANIDTQNNFANFSEFTKRVRAAAGLFVPRLSQGNRCRHPAVD